MKNIHFEYVPELSKGNEESGNLLIQGDNKDILPLLATDYKENVKCIYIDPPYNNGDNYHYYNDKKTGESWIKEISNVLTWLRVLLSKDGSIWISIDDNEMAYLKVAADKIFGRENFAGTIVWQQRKTRENRAVFSTNHEYILVYAKNLKSFKRSRNLLPVDDGFINEKYKNPDNDPRGAWQSVSASVQAGHAVASQFYTIVSPAGVEFNPPKGRCWVYNQERMNREIQQNNIWFGQGGTSVPRIKKFLSSAKIGLTPQTLWSGDEFGTTDSAKKHLLSIFKESKNIFDTPKPEELIKRILDIASNENDIVLDCYLGSGTTASVAHKMGRRYIGIEIGAQMTELITKRLNSVIAGENAGISPHVHWKGGGDYAFFRYIPTPAQRSMATSPKVSELNSQIKKPTYRQINLFDLLEQYPDIIVENHAVSEPDATYSNFDISNDSEVNRNLLICLVKNDNIKEFIDRTATIYYTGKKFPACVALNKLYYFMPYFKGKGIKDLYLIKIARVGKRKEGQPEEDEDDLRLVFEIQFVRQLFEEYKPIELKIWRSFTDTTLSAIFRDTLTPRI